MNEHTTIYVQLLNDGTSCWRPVPAKHVSGSVYILEGQDIFDPDDEEWEFLPGSTVVVAEKNLTGVNCLVATYVLLD